MPKISALVHITNNEPNLGRALESLRPCDEVIVVDHGCNEQSLKVAHEHGARTIKGVNGVDRGAYIQDARHDWIFCLHPSESVAEELEASLLEWKQSEPPNDLLGYNIRIRQQNGTQWRLLEQELRLANRTKVNWTGDCPPAAPDAPILAGHILRIPEEQ
jgi:glycosyltransferase involved in cell wall biosynthesis